MLSIWEVVYLIAGIFISYFNNRSLCIFETIYGNYNTIMQKPHLFFRNPKDGVVALRQLPRYSGNGDEDEGSIIEKDYTFLKETLKNSRRVYLNEVIERNRNRNPNLEIPEKFDCILIEFFDYFNIGTFETKYRNDFGLTPVKYFEFNTVGLFAVADEDKFRSFLGEIEKFAKSNDSQNDSSFDRKLLYIKGFSFFHQKEGSGQMI